MKNLWRNGTWAAMSMQRCAGLWTAMGRGAHFSTANSTRSTKPDDRARMLVSSRYCCLSDHIPNLKPLIVALSANTLIPIYLCGQCRWMSSGSNCERAAFTAIYEGTADGKVLFTLLPACMQRPVHMTLHTHKITVVVSNMPADSQDFGR